MAIEFVMLFTIINKTKQKKEGMYTYTCICSIIKLINEAKKKRKTGEKIRSAGLLYSYVCLTNRNGVITNEDKRGKMGRQRPSTLNEGKPGIEEQYKYLTDIVCYSSRQTNRK